MKKTIIFLILVLAIALVAFGCSKSQPETSTQEQVQDVQPVLEESVEENIVIIENSDEQPEETQSNTKEFTVHGSSFTFEPLELRVKKGNTVKINFISDDIGHNLVINEFNTRTSIISNGAGEVVEFVADREGTFDIYCSVGQHRALGMEGQIIVEP